MIDKLSTIIFLVGLLMLIFIQAYNQKQMVTMTIIVVISIFLIGGAWILREFRNSEKYKYAYDYENAYQTGKLVGGTVYSSYPEDVGGLGWVL